MKQEFIVLSRSERGGEVSGKMLLAVDRESAMAKVKVEGVLPWQACYKLGEAYEKMLSNLKSPEATAIREAILKNGMQEEIVLEIPSMGKKWKQKNGQQTMRRVAKTAAKMGLKIIPMTLYQYRIIGDNNNIDFYPISGKYNVVGTLQYKFTDDMEKKLKELFPA